MRGLSGARIALAIMVVIGLLASGLTVLQDKGNDNVSVTGFSTFPSDQELRAYINAHAGTSNNIASFDLAETAQKGAASHTDTNTQVEGIDELDQIETDGRYIFIASSVRVDIIEVMTDGNLRNVSTIADLQGDGPSAIYVQGIFLHGDRLVVVVSVQHYFDAPSVWIASELYYWGSNEVIVVTYDVGAPGSPVKLGSRGMTGWYTSSRLIDDHLYVLTQQSVWGSDGPIVPQFSTDGLEQVIPASSVQYDAKSIEVQSYSNVLSMELTSLECSMDSVLMGYGSTIYASNDAIYLTCQEWEAASYGDVVSNGKVWTDIYRLDLNGSSASLSAKGRVEGYLNNQFCMDEKDGLLRLTTCVRFTVSESMVFVLDRDLRILGELRGLGPNETIQAARFIDDTLYLVTFLQTDPLFVIDLSDPADPSLAGELIIPGFSTYLHEVGGGDLVGVGVENGTLKLSLYNVSDPTAPREVSKVIAPAWAWSVALWDHHAFMYDPGSGIIAVPVQMCGAHGEYNAGAYLFQLSEGNLDLIGLVQNGNESSQARCLMVGGMLLTITESSVASWDIDGLNELDHLVYSNATRAWGGFSEGDVRATGAI